MAMERYEVHGVKVYQLNICESDQRSPSLSGHHDVDCGNHALAENLSFNPCMPCRSIARLAASIALVASSTKRSLAYDRS